MSPIDRARGEAPVNCAITGHIRFGIDGGLTELTFCPEGRNVAAGVDFDSNAKPRLWFRESNGSRRTNLSNCRTTCINRSNGYL